jgi:hypothetical protein
MPLSRRSNSVQSRELQTHERGPLRAIPEHDTTPGFTRKRARPLPAPALLRWTRRERELRRSAHCCSPTSGSPDMPVGWPEQGRFRGAELVSQFATSAHANHRRGLGSTDPAGANRSAVSCKHESGHDCVDVSTAAVGVEGPSRLPASTTPHGRLLYASTGSLRLVAAMAAKQSRVAPPPTARRSRPQALRTPPSRETVC